MTLLLTGVGATGLVVEILAMQVMERSSKVVLAGQLSQALEVVLKCPELGHASQLREVVFQN